MFSSFLSDDSNKYATRAIAHRKRIITLLKKRNILYAKLGTLLENTDGCAGHYRCANVLYLVSMLSQSLSVIINCGISTPGHRR